MQSRVYPEISQFAGNKAAVYIGATSFSNLALTSFRSALSTTVGKVVSLAVSPFAVRFDAAKTPAGPAVDVDTEFEQRGKGRFLRAMQPMKLTFSMGVLDANGMFASLLSTLVLKVEGLEFAIDVSTARLVVSPGEAKPVPSFLRDKDFDTTLQQYHLDKDTATRVEGMLLYSGLATALTQTVSVAQQVDLKRLFPGLVFHGQLQLALSIDRQYLFVTGSHGMTRANGPCDCADPGDGRGPNKPGEVKPAPSPPEPSDGSVVGTITIGGPTRVAPTSAILGRRGSGQGDSGVYLPNAFAESLVQGPFPAVRLDIQDNGFIGWKAAGIVDFNGFQFTPDPAQGRFFVDLKSRVEVYGNIHVDLGKLGKIRITSFSAEQAAPGVNAVRIGFYVVIGTEGLYLKPVLENLTFGTFQVSLLLGTLIGTPFGTWGAVIGFIFDEILSRIIAYQIPVELELELRRYVAQVMFPLLTAHYAAEIEGLLHRKPGTGAPPLRALFDGGPHGFLFSTGLDPEHQIALG